MPAFCSVNHFLYLLPTFDRLFQELAIYHCWWDYSVGWMQDLYPVQGFYVMWWSQCPRHQHKDIYLPWSSDLPSPIAWDYFLPLSGLGLDSPRLETHVFPWVFFSCVWLMISKQCPRSFLSFSVSTTDFVGFGRVRKVLILRVALDKNRKARKEGQDPLLSEKGIKIMHCSLRPFDHCPSNLIHSRSLWGRALKWGKQMPFIAPNLWTEVRI